MDPQTTNNTNDGITDLSSIKSPNESESVNQISQTNPSQDQQDNTSFGELFGQDTPEESSKTNPEQVPSISNVTAKTEIAEPSITPTPELTQQNNIDIKKQENVSQLQGNNKNVTIIFIVFISIAILALGGFLIYKNYSEKKTVTTFEECMAVEGSVLEESYPPVCSTKDGASFIAEVAEEEIPTNIVPAPTPKPIEEKTMAEICYEQSSNIECAEGTLCMSNPASAFCSCMDGQTEIRESETGDQYGVCMVGGIEYDEWEYLRMNTPLEENTEEDSDTASPEQSGSEVGSPFGDLNNLKYTLNKSEGSCTTDSQCVWENQGCGGGHGVCTNEPEKYEGMVTTCEVDPEFPSNLGYTCGCVETLGKCGWEK